MEAQNQRFCQDKFESGNSFYPTLEHFIDNQLVEVDQEIYRLNRTNEIIKELKKEEKHYQSVYKKYKKLHKTIYITQLLCNSTSIVSGACTAGTLTTVVGIKKKKIKLRLYMYNK